MNKAYNYHPVTGKLWRALRTTTLLAGASLSSALMVNLPYASAAHAHGQGETSPSYVPTSDRWISLGTETQQDRKPVPASAIDGLEATPATPSR